MEDAGRVVDKIHDIAFDVALGRARDAHGFVEGDVDVFLLRLFNDFAVYLNFVVRPDFAAKLRRLAVDCDAAGFDEFIGAAARGDARFT